MIDILLTETTLDPVACISKVTDARSGAVNTFIGTVRSSTAGRQVKQLEFEAYEPMAKAEMIKIGQEVMNRWNAHAVSIHHRTGTLKIGDLAVIIAVSTPHRSAAFEACKYAIDTLKETVPIWKKEVFEDGEVWVAAHP